MSPLPGMPRRVRSKPDSTAGPGVATRPPAFLLPGRLDPDDEVLAEGP